MAVSVGISLISVQTEYTEVIDSCQQKRAALMGRPRSQLRFTARSGHGAPDLWRAGGLTKDQRLLDLHHFFLLRLAHIFHLLDLTIGELLDFIQGAFLVVLGNFLVLHGLFNSIVAIAANVADSRSMFFQHFVQVFHQILAPVFGQWWN